MRVECQRNMSFNDCYAFELLSQHLKHTTLQTYEQWRDVHWIDLLQVKQYQETSSSLAPFVVKTEQAWSVVVVDVVGAFLKKKILASASTSTSSLIFSLLSYVQATQAALTSLGVRLILILCRNSSSNQKKNMEVSVGIKCSGSKTPDERQMRHIESCT